MSKSFRVWAPTARQLTLQLDGHDHPMPAVGRGWWGLEVESVGPGSRYAFCVDGGPARPDPRSQFQPAGVHGPSELVDHDAFRWHDSQWRGLPLQGSVLYELHVGTFSPPGTFDGALPYLDHLVELGVDAIELLPVAEFSGERGWGYDGVDLFAPHHAYGGPDGLKRLIDACHVRGLGVVMDVVYNHLGPCGNYLPEFGPYFNDRRQTHWGAAVNFDGEESAEVRRFVIDNALMWLRDYHCDGLRLDAVHAIIDSSPLHILEQLASEVDALACHLRKPLFLIAESDLNDPRLVESPDRGGYGLQAAWADDWHHALHAVLTGERDGYYADYGSLPDLMKALSQAWVYDGRFSAYQAKERGRRPTGLNGHQFVVCTQNHDQVGNRARGERLTGLTTPARLKLAAALLLTGPFVPLLFQGEEWAAGTPFQYFVDFQDPDLRTAVRDGRRREFARFGWDPERIPDPNDAQTFARSKLDWSELDQHEHADILNWYRRLICLRRRVPALTDPRLDRQQVTCNEAGNWFLIQRSCYLVAGSLAPSPVVVPVPEGTTLVAASGSSVHLSDQDLLLPPDHVAILELP
ncbi:MAG TPA: malto-oligosyltrehalose trehalohydrolase [Acidimicrobiales bacterium]|nr:malto-oligosyltrehalose trehalohydrolase [Acidimicrobiales bacterium]